MNWTVCARLLDRPRWPQRIRGAQFAIVVQAPPTRGPEKIALAHKARSRDLTRTTDSVRRRCASLAGSELK